MSHILLLSLQVQKILVKWKGMYNSLTNTHTHTHLGVPGLRNINVYWLAQLTVNTPNVEREQHWQYGSLVAALSRVFMQ